MRSHKDERRETEAGVAVHALNRMLELGRPISVRVARPRTELGRVRLYSKSVQHAGWRRISPALPPSDGRQGGTAPSHFGGQKQTLHRNYMGGASKLQRWVTIAGIGHRPRWPMRNKPRHAFGGANKGGQP